MLATSATVSAAIKPLMSGFQSICAVSQQAQRGTISMKLFTPADLELVVVGTKTINFTDLRRNMKHTQQVALCTALLASLLSPSLSLSLTSSTLSKSKRSMCDATELTDACHLLFAGMSVERSKRIQRRHSCGCG